MKQDSRLAQVFADSKFLNNKKILCHHEAHEGHEESGNYYISISSFVLPSALLRACFATFVVIMSVSILVVAQPRWVLCGEA